MPGRPANRPISGTPGAVATKSRPCRPSDFHATSDAGLPDRVGDVGALTPAVVLPWVTDAAWLATSTALRHGKPWTNPISKTTTSTDPTPYATGLGTNGPSSRATLRVARRSDRAIER